MLDILGWSILLNISEVVFQNSSLLKLKYKIGLKYAIEFLFNKFSTVIRLGLLVPFSCVDVLHVQVHDYSQGSN
jgi:hypothetical protein